MVTKVESEYKLLLYVLYFCISSAEQSKLSSRNSSNVHNIQSLRPNMVTYN